jgi:hypothetical protein
MGVQSSEHDSTDGDPGQFEVIFGFIKAPVFFKKKSLHIAQCLI